MRIKAPVTTQKHTLKILIPPLQRRAKIEHLNPSRLFTLFRKQLRDLPIAINVLADPAILRESTAAKLDALVSDKHTGPVALVTKGNLSTSWWRERLPHWASKLDMYIFASVSGLPKSYEPVPLEHRFSTLRAAHEAGAKSIAYVRPIVPGVNDTPENLRYLVESAKEAGADAVVSSGFRGTPSIIESSGFKRHKLNEWQEGWLPSVKLHTENTESFLRDYCNKLDIPFWTGTSCAVAALRGETRSYSPYHIAPQFAGCDSCTLKSSCHDSRYQMVPPQGALELLRFLGYETVFSPGIEGTPGCQISRRSDCSLHCTNCPRSTEFKYPHITINRFDGSVPSWGDLCLARFITKGMVCTHPELSPTEESTIRLHPRFEYAESGADSLYATTSWMMWSEYLPKERCFGCSYCFVGMYKDALPEPMKGTVGDSPLKILQRVLIDSKKMMEETPYV